MAPSRRLSNGRSPLVNQQRQITSFFTPGKNSTQPSSISPPEPKKTPNPNFTHNPNQTSTPSPQEKRKKPLLVIGPSLNRSSPSPNQTSTPSPQDAMFSPTSGKKSYSEEVVGKRIKVFWPLDESWYEGCVKSFDKTSGKHLVQYDDAEEEVLDLDKEKTEFLEDTAKKFRRLRRKSLICEIQNHEKENSDEESGRDDDSMDEDWGGNVKAMEDVDSEEVDLEDDVEELEQGKSKPTKVKYSGSGKRKALDGEISVSAKKSRVRITGSAEKSFLKVSPIGNVGRLNDPPSSVEREPALNIFNNKVTGDAVERYSTREAEKFGFLGAKRRDANGRRPGDANYDPRTLYLPSDFLKSLTGGQRQWWEFKSKHMDKVLFFKMGKFYELFEMDAHIGAKELDLQYMKGEQPHCGFPEKNFAINVEKLTKKGYRVLVVEQTETPEQLELRRKNMGSKDKVVKREICAVVTKGTLTEGEMLSVNPDAAYMISVTEKCQYSADQENYTVIGVCVADVSTSRFMLGQFEDDSDRHCLCSILSELRPVEIIKPTNVLSAETEKVLLRHTRNPLVNDLIPCVEFWDAEKTVKEVKNIYKQFGDQVKASENDECRGISADLRYLPDILFKLVSEGDKGNLALAAFGGCLFYLRQAFLDETLLKFAKFESLPCMGFINALQKPYMSLDSSALENLEILENNSDGGISGTLFAQLDHCVTMFGKRLLKNWLARPLYHKKLIVERQDAIAGLKGLASALEFRKELSRLPDMERLLSRLFASCEANGRNANKVVLYEDASKKQLQEFVCALRGCQSMTQACFSLSSVLDTVESSLLNQLLTPGKGLPDVHSVLKHFEDAFDWLEADQSGRIIPHEGVDTEYDSACTSVTMIESCLEKHLDEQRKLLRDRSIKFVSVGKESYLLEVPESLQGSVPRDYELRSSKKGFFRYWTPRIKELLAELSQTEGEKESKLKSILQRLIGLFCEHHIKWRQLVSTTAELDVLISLSIASDYYEGPTCRPAIKGTSCLMEGSPRFSAKNLGHPVLRSDGLGKGSFVPNDVTIGGAEHADFILLTGPNMGGKSTLLRQICLAVILAQVGADVPADSFELSPVDCIFVRMGARDHIMAGQSTFLTELSETAAMLSSATQNSLVALDELGRGTSTSDGQAIAQSVLEHFIRKVGCRGIFSTHYHRLAVDYEQDPKVALRHMACRVGKGVRGVEEVTFLYRLTPGACPKSYGVNVARLAGLPDSILHKAATKSIQFESNYGKHHHGVSHKSSSHAEEDETAVIRDILNVLVPTSCHEDSKTIGASELRELQQRVRLLLQGN